MNNIEYKIPVGLPEEQRKEHEAILNTKTLPELKELSKTLNIDGNGGLRKTYSFQYMMLQNEEKIQPLKDKEIFNYITETELNKKIVEEINTRKTVFLCANGRLVENANKASYNLLVNADAGIGKDHVVKQTLKIIPNENWEHKTRITEKVLTYWHTPKTDPNWTWDGKCLYLEDISNNVLNSDVFKVFASSGSKATVLINQTAVEIEIKGKPVLIITSASASPNNELLRRFTICDLDESIDQTKLIMKRKAEAATKGKTLEYDEKIIEAQKYLKRISVIIPFAEKLLDIFPTNHIIMRTHFERFLDYIKASCAFHQYQREIDKEGFYIATGQDYDVARLSLIKTTSNKEMIPLTKDDKKILELFENGLEKNKNYTIKDLEPRVKFLGERQLRRILKKLAGYGFLRTDREDRDGVKQSVLVYGYESFIRVKIPTWSEIDEYIRNLSNVSNDEKVSKVASVSKDRTFDTFDTFDNENQVKNIPKDYEEINMNLSASEKKKQILDYILKNPKDNGAYLDSKYESLIQQMISYGDIEENPNGTYRLLE